MILCSILASFFASMLVVSVIHMGSVLLTCICGIDYVAVLLIAFFKEMSLKSRIKELEDEKKYAESEDTE